MNIDIGLKEYNLTIYTNCWANTYVFGNFAMMPIQIIECKGKL